MKFEHFIIALLMPAGLLLIAGGAAFQHFQDWTLTPAYAQMAPASVSLPPPSAKQAVALAKTPISPQSEVTTRDEANHAVIVQAFTHTIRQAKADVPTLVETPARITPDTPPLTVQNVQKPHPVMASTRPSTPSLPSQVSSSPSAQNHNTTSSTNLRATTVLYNDEIVLAMPKALASEQTIKRAVGRILLSAQAPETLDLLSTESIDYRQRPFLYRRVIDQDEQPIRYPRAAFRYADYLIAHHRVELEDEEGRFVHIHIPLVPSNLAEPARRYEPWVLEFAEQFNVSAALIFAIMETESHFNPLAVSRSNAKGLMQIKPNAAGRDVYQYIDFKLGVPPDEELFDAQSNIRLGTAYLSLLKHDYFADIRHAEVREMVAIASYNGGLTTVWRLFGRTPQEAIAHINRLNPRQVYRTLRHEHASDETRRYIDKVLQAKQRYQALLGDDSTQLLARR